MRITVTGAAGFLGINLLNELVAQGHEVTGVDHRLTKLDENRIAGVQWREGDVLDGERMTELFVGADIVYHLVAKITLRREDPAAWRLNTVGVRTVAEAALAAGVARLVHCSSVHSFDTVAGTAIDERSARATDGAELPLYDRSKFAGEQELQRVIARGLDATIANPTGVFGPIDHPKRLSRMNGILRDAAAGRVPVDMQGGFDWVDARDVARGLTLVAEHGRTGENHLLGGDYLSMHDALSIAANSVGRRAPAMTLPLGVLKAIMPLAEPIGRRLGSDVMSTAALGSLMAAPRVDHSKAAAFGYAPRPPEQTIRDLVSWFVQVGVLDRNPSLRMKSRGARERGSGAARVSQ
ncbi:MAG TPA: NAD-dependent epimerase/dehydratase family protein [Agromyces sp.]|nr:NAD-dependent epimerase/dehydratase family protein [Agromyces sp.]